MNRGLNPTPILFNNIVIICWGYGSSLTVSANITYPITFTKIPTLLGVGFVIQNVARQTISQRRINGFTTSYDQLNCGTYSYMSIGY